jgi:formamidopyrimidine-DNA glycosylase
MPELPEVETVLNGLKPHLENTIIQDVVIRHDKLRWPISQNLKQHLINQSIGKISRRGKYLLIPIGDGTLLIHLGMSGSLRIMLRTKPAKKHDHVDIIYSKTHLLRFTDPRRFGCLLWTNEDPLHHALLKNLGPEPLSEDFTSDYLFQIIQNRKRNIKDLLMDSHIIVGIGNIYAAEILFLSKIHPATSAKLLSRKECVTITHAIKQVLTKAITQGGTTIKDFINSQGKPGYFAQKLYVYGRANKPCQVCKTLLIQISLGQRSTVFCPHCQKQGRT